jgi:aspartate kinase
MTVAKFGGTSLATVESIRAVGDIVRKEKYSCIVVSAPGKRFPDDVKVTDLLVRWFYEPEHRDTLTEELCERYGTLADGLGICPSMRHRVRASLKSHLVKHDSYVISRGEALMAGLVAEYLQFKHIDAYDCMYCVEGEVKVSGRFVRKLSPQKPVVVPGFYYRKSPLNKCGGIGLLSRGGSDYTGALIAATAREPYHNWTDIDGVYSADPRVVEHAHSLPELSYEEMRELSFAGAKVFHEDAMLPMIDADQVTYIKNTFDPKKHGTKLSSSPRPHRNIFTGVSALKGYTAITIKEPGLHRRPKALLSILSAFDDIPIEHVPTGVDIVTVVVESTRLHESVLSKLRTLFPVGTVIAELNWSVMVVVGCSMTGTPGVLAQVATVLAQKKINVHFVSQGASELSMVFGIHDSQCDEAVRAVHMLIE